MISNRRLAVPDRARAWHWAVGAVKRALNEAALPSGGFHYGHKAAWALSCSPVLLSGLRIGDACFFEEEINALKSAAEMGQAKG